MFQRSAGFSEVVHQQMLSLISAQNIHSICLLGLSFDTKDTVFVINTMEVCECPIYQKLQLAINFSNGPGFYRYVSFFRFFSRPSFGHSSFKAIQLDDGPFTGIDDKEGWISCFVSLVLGSSVCLFEARYE